MRILNKTSIGALLISLMLGLSGQTAFAAGPAAVNLGTAGNFAILSETGISNTGPTSIVGNIGVSPATSNQITGFGLVLPPPGAAPLYSGSALVNGHVYASDYAAPTTANLATAVSDMQTAYASANEVSPTVTGLGSGNIGGMTITPGVYNWTTGVTISDNITLSGSASDVWIFQIAQNLTVGPDVRVTLSGGAQDSNIFWVVAGQTTVGAVTVFNGNILDRTAIVLNDGAQLNGLALAQASVFLNSNAVAASASAQVQTPNSAPILSTPVRTPGSASTSPAISPTTVGSSGIPYAHPVGAYQIKADISYLQGQLLVLLKELQALIKAGQ
jgi:hypothetical protein